MEVLLQACLQVADWAQARLAPHRPRTGVAGVALFFFVVVGLPVLTVLWGYATGRLPAPSPYSD